MKSLKLTFHADCEIYARVVLARRFNSTWFATNGCQVDIFAGRYGEPS